MSFTEGTTVFLLSVTGQVSSGHFPDLDDLYCHHSFVTGPDWAVTAGLSDGLSQSARRREGGTDHKVVWNFPVDVTFRSTSPYGWPQVDIITGF
jgi:B9 domain-containing protein 1